MKTRRGTGFGTLAEAVDALKVRRLPTVSAPWLAAHPTVRGEIRFDVRSIMPQPRGAATVEHLKEAF